MLGKFYREHRTSFQINDPTLVEDLKGLGNGKEPRPEKPAGS